VPENSDQRFYRSRQCVITVNTSTSYNTAYIIALMLTVVRDFGPWTFDDTPINVTVIAFIPDVIHVPELSALFSTRR